MASPLFQALENPSIEDVVEPNDWIDVGVVGVSTAAADDDDDVLVVVSCLESVVSLPRVIRKLGGSRRR